MCVSVCRHLTEYLLLIYNIEPSANSPTTQAWMRLPQQRDFLCETQQSHN